MTTAQDLFNDYNQYRFHTTSIQEKRAAGAYIRSLKYTPERVRAFTGLSSWCGERNIDSRHWLYTLFVARHWRFAPPLNQLRSKKHLERYEAMEAPGYRDQRQAEADKGEQVYNVNRDLSHSVETLKKHIMQFGGPKRCMSKMDTETFGFHPKSSVCSMCPIAAACESQLQTKAVGFDITALRRGDITLYQATASQAYHGGR